MKVLKTSIPIYLVALVFLGSCHKSVERTDFDAFLNEPCMLVNYEQDNTKEGRYLRVAAVSLIDSVLSVQLPDGFFINNTNCKNWVVGWGYNVPLYDAGVENIREIRKIDVVKNTVYYGQVLRGAGLPAVNQRLVFLNIHPSGFINYLKKPVINPDIWPEFSGKSLSFSSIEYDSLLGKWVMIVNECDTSKIQIYAAVSSNLKDWEAANNGKAILKASDFINCTWAGRDKTGKLRQTPFVSDIVRYGSKWFLFLDGYSRDRKRHIGTAVSLKSLIGPYKVSKTPVISPGKAGEWNDESCFYAKVKKSREGFTMFYDGRDKSGIECVGMAKSDNLEKWINYEYNPVVDQHTGWRSFVGCTEPNYIEIHGDTILLMIAGVKKFKPGSGSRFVPNRMYMDISGNVGDAQLGFYISIDGGRSFTAHKNNPVFVNDYTNVYENEHMGGNFKLIKTDTADIIIYQAKSSFDGLKYNILLREKQK